MAIEKIVELLITLILGTLFVFLLSKRRLMGPGDRGLKLLIIGLGLVTLGATIDFIDLDDRFPPDSPGDIVWNLVLELIIGYTTGIILLGLGLALWVPAVMAFKAEVREREKTQNALLQTSEELKQTVAALEDQLRFESSFTQLTASYGASTDYDKIIVESLECVANLLSCDAAEIWQLADSGDSAEPIACWYAPTIDREMAKESSRDLYPGLYALADQGTSISLPDIAKDIEPPDRDHLMQLGVQALCATPVSVERVGRWYLLFGSNKPLVQPWTKEQISHLQLVARHIINMYIRKLNNEKIRSLQEQLEAENLYLQEELEKSHPFKEIIGESQPLLELLRKVEQVAPIRTTVLITGESGTGKELIARAIHDNSDRRHHPPSSR